VETPYAGDIELNLRYLRAVMHDALVNHNEAPFASHGLYTQPGVLCDGLPDERVAGIHAGFAWRELADATVVYTDLGISKGMQYGIDHAIKHGKPIEYRSIMGQLCPSEIRIHLMVDEERELSTAMWGKP
jgi:hypothetical protein